MILHPKNKLLFIGDSITSGARNFALGGEGRTDDAYGTSYVLLVKSILDAWRPDLHLRVVNKGIGGNTIRDLAGRWEEDVLAPAPDCLTVMVGINDVWRQFDTPHMPETHVGPEEFRDTYHRLLQTARERLDLKTLLVATPYVLDTNRADAMRHRMDEYGKIAREAAAAHNAIFIDVQAAFDAYLEHYHPNQLCWDRIHPSLSGHMVIARAWLRAVGFSW